MDLFGGPAVLGGIIICVALGAWMLGRWQGGLVPAADLVCAETPVALNGQQEPRDQEYEDPAPRTPCQQAAQAERRGAVEAASSLGDLHAEVSAYRRAEQVLVRMEREQLDMVLVAADAGQECRYVGISGQPTCPMSDAVRHRSSCGAGCAAFRLPPQRAVQPSLCASDFTRV